MARKSRPKFERSQRKRWPADAEIYYRAMAMIATSSGEQFPTAQQWALWCRDVANAAEDSDDERLVELIR